MISGQVRLYLTAEVFCYQQKLQFNHKRCDPCVEDFVGQTDPMIAPSWARRRLVGADAWSWERGQVVKG
jgi:hypothetical protein